MKYHNKLFKHLIIFCFSLLTIALFIVFVNANSTLVNESTSKSNETTVTTPDSKDSCIHSVYYTFNEKDKTIDDVYTNWKVEGLIFDVKTFSHDGIKVFYEGNEITEGYFKEGMRVQIFHGETLFAEYTVASLLEPEENINVNNTASTLSNSNSFGLPIDNIILRSDKDNGNISVFFNEVSSSSPTPHRGIDIARGGHIDNIAGYEIKAIESGTVILSQTWDGVTIDPKTMQSYGNCVKIRHSDGFVSLYAHMISPPTLKEGSYINKGETVGYVGQTGFAQGDHLHLEMSLNSELVDPLDYLAEDSSKNGWYRENGNTYYYENGLTKRGWWHLRSSSYYFDPDTGVMATGFTKIDTHYYYFYPSGDFDGTRGQLLTGWLDIYDNGELRYFYPDGMWDGTRGRMMYGFQPINGSTYLLDPDTGIMTKGWKAYPDSSSIYFFGDDGVMRTGWYHRSGSSTCHYFYPSTGKMALGLQEINGHTYYFHTSGMWDGTRGQAMLGWQTVNGGLRYFYPDGDFDGTRGQMLLKFQTIDGKTYFFDPDTGIRTVGWKAYPNSSSIYYFDEDGVMQTGWWHRTGKTTLYYFYKDGKLATGLSNIDGAYYYCYPSGMWDGTRGQVMTGWRDIDGSGELRYFSETGTLDGEKGMMMTLWFKVGNNTYFGDPTTGIVKTGLFNYPAGSTNYYYFNASGVMQTGSVKVNGKLYYFDKSTGRRFDAFFGWLDANKDGSEIYFVNADKSLLTGWYTSGTNPKSVYYYDPETGKMAMGLTQIGEYKYLFRADGALDGTRGKMIVDWYEDEEGVRFFYSAGEVGDEYGSMMEGLFTYFGTQYYFHIGTGLRASGWIHHEWNGRNYYCREDGTVYRGWLQIGANGYYLDETLGWLTTGFVEIKGEHYYFNPDGELDGTLGQLLTGWRTIDGGKRYFYRGGAINGEKGKMKTLWFKVGVNTYFGDPETGIVKTGLFNYPADSTYCYYFNERGAMQTGAVNIDGNLYYFDKSTGRRVISNFGWYDPNKDGSEIYFFDYDHYLTAGWMTSGANKKDVHYFDPQTGQMAMGLTQIGEYKYMFRSDGALNGTRGKMIVDWYEDEEGVRFFYGAGEVGDEYGSMMEGLFTYLGTRYYFHIGTGLRASGWVYHEWNDRYYYCREDGTIYNGWLETDNGLNGYYLDETFGWLTTGFVEIKGEYYYFNPDGELGGTLGQLMTGWHKVNDEWHYFEQGGAIDGTRGKMRKDM